MAFTAGSCIKLYADDVKLYFEIVNDSDVVTLHFYSAVSASEDFFSILRYINVHITLHYIDKFAKWAQTWQLSLSAEKCCHIRLGLLACKSSVNYHINDIALNTVDTVRDLGISIDNKLTFVEHKPNRC